MQNRLIEVINRLHSVFSSAPSLGNELEIPQIVVIGSQSSGKSSILENIVGFEFLPRGTDIVTRCPIVLQLQHITEGCTVGEFSHLPDIQFDDFFAIKKEIINRTKVLAGDNKGISKIPVGSQPKDIENLIREIILSYARKPSALLLAIVPANIDIVNSEALKFVSEIDPSGQRTLGVLSKIDLMDHGTNALDILLNRGPIRLAHGFVGVICRSQKAINEGVSIQQSLENELKFFSSHPIYKGYPAIKVGTESLSQTLTFILLKHIKQNLPFLRSQIMTLFLNTQTELKSIESLSLINGSTHDLTCTPTGKGCLILKLLTKFSSEFEDAIQGTSRQISTSELVGGARLQMIFHDTFATAIRSYDPTASLSLNDIRTAIRNANGAKPSLFVPEMSFELLSKQQIAQLEPPSLFCANMVYDELLKLISTCASSDLARYPNLQKKVCEVASHLIKERLDPTRSMVQSLIAIELAYINTNHPDFCKAGAALAALEKTKENAKISIDSHQTRDTYTLHSESQSSSGVQNINSISSISPQVGTNQANANGRIFNFLFRSSAPSHSSSNNNVENLSSRAMVIGEGPSGMASDKALSSTSSPASSPSIPDASPIIPPAILAMAPELTSVSRKPQLPETKSFTEKEEMETHLILTLIRSYFNVVRKNIIDLVPKAIMHFLVNAVKENLHNRLVTELYRSDSEVIFDQLLQEDPAIVKERQRISNILSALTQALEIVSEIDDMTSD